MGLFDKYLKPVKDDDKRDSGKDSGNHKNDSVCPHCGTMLDKKPARKLKCPHCSKDIYVRSKQSLFPSSLVTRTQADAIDEFKVIEYGNNITEKDYWAENEKLTRKFGKAASPKDTIWGLYNNLISRLVKQQAYNDLASTYYSMALFLNKEEKDAKYLLEQANKMRLLAYKREGYLREVDILLMPDGVCSKCEELSGKVFKIDDALKTTVLPPEGCTCKLSNEGAIFCGCSFLPKVR